jgi:ABC-type phosphate/phosphonate transport system substrate-binding protein
MPSHPSQTGLLSFGYVAPNVTASARLAMATYWIEVGQAAGLELIVIERPSYEALTRSFLERRKAAVPLVTHRRDGSSSFQSVLVAHRGAELKRVADLVGKRAAWIDQYSASGYVLPRIELAKRGIDPKTAFTTERFYRSHTAAIRAVLERRADFAGTWLGRDAKGVIVRAPWTDMVGGEAIRIIDAFGIIPSDTIAARAALAPSDADKVCRALIATSKTHPHLVRDLFGVDEFSPWVSEGYDVLQDSTTRASEDGLLEGIEKGDRSSGRLA